MTEELLDRPLRSPPLDLSPRAVASVLRAEGIRVCCLVAGDPAPATHSGPPSTPREALEAIVRDDPRYRWEVTDGGLLDLYPSPSVLDDEVPAVAVARKGLWAVLEDDLDLKRHGIELFMEFRDGDGPPVSAEVPAGTLRNALGRLIAPVDGTVWDISGTPGAFHLTITAIA